MNNYSHTKLEKYIECPSKYSRAYIDKSEKSGDTLDAFMGTMVHKALEWLYPIEERWIKNKIDKEESRKKLIERFNILWNDEIEKKQNKVGKLKSKEHDKEHFLNLGIMCLENYHDRYYPFNEAKTIGIEKRIRIKEIYNDSPFKGEIDRISIKGNTIEIHDYKTSKRITSYKNNTPFRGLKWIQKIIDKWYHIETKEERQLKRYAVLVRYEYPQFKKFEIKGFVHYVRLDETIEVKIEEADVKKTKDSLVKVIDTIEKDNRFNCKCNFCSKEESESIEASKKRLEARGSP